MNWPHNALRPYHEAVRYAESHDSVSGQEGSKQRIVKREAYGHGRRMAKAIGNRRPPGKGHPHAIHGRRSR
jgi:hypothetical protein